MVYVFIAVSGVFMRDCVRSTLEIKRGLLKARFYTASARDMIENINERIARINQWAAEDSEKIKAIDAQEKADEALLAERGSKPSRAIRALNLVREMSGCPERLQDGWYERHQALMNGPMPSLAVH